MLNREAYASMLPFFMRLKELYITLEIQISQDANKGNLEGRSEKSFSNLPKKKFK